MATLNIALAALVLSFGLSLFIGPGIIRALRALKFGQKILEDGPTWHMSKQNTPTMGGLIFVLCTAASVCAAAALAATDFALFGTSLDTLLDTRALLMLAFSLVFGAIGLIDDYTKIKKTRNKGLTAMQKLLLQIAAAALFLTVMRLLGYIAPSVYIPFVGVTFELPWGLYLLFFIFVIVGCVNAVNLTDGVDGLAGSVTLIITVFFGVSFVLLRAGGPALFAGGLAGGLIGFLCFNFHPAKVFMGDTGSLFLGGAVCAMAFALDMPVILALAGIVYVVEALSDIIQVVYFKATKGKRVFKMAPIHHHFEMSGWGERKVVAVFGAVTLLACAAALMAVLERYPL